MVYRKFSFTSAEVRVTTVNRNHTNNQTNASSYNQTYPSTTKSNLRVAASQSQEKRVLAKIQSEGLITKPESCYYHHYPNHHGQRYVAHHSVPPTAYSEHIMSFCHIMSPNQFRTPFAEKNFRP